MRLPSFSEMIGREPAIPIVLSVYSMDLYGVVSPEDHGRVLLGHYQAHTGKMSPSLRDDVRPNDVVFVPLYDGLRLPDRCLADDTSVKIEFYEENIEFIEDVAKRVRGILVGNAGPETSFKHVWLKDHAQPRSMISHMMSDFVSETSDIIRGFGGTPFYGAVDWDLAVDCYFGDATFREAVNAAGGGNICFTGYNLFGPGSDVPNPIVPSSFDQMFWPCCPIKERLPKPRLMEYLRGGDTWWSGMDMLAGLERGNDQMLAEKGFNGGVMGLPTERLLED